MVCDDLAGFIGEFRRQDFRIGIPDPERDQIAHVSKNGGADGWEELIDILVRESETLESCCYAS